MVGNVIIPNMVSNHDGTTSITGFTLMKTTSNEKMSSWRGIDSTGKAVVVTLTQGSAKPTSDSYGRVRARMKVVTQVPEVARKSVGVNGEGVPVYPTTFVDSIADISISVPVSLGQPVFDSYAAQVLGAVLKAAPEIISEASL